MLTLDGDDAFVADLVHGFGDQVADGLVTSGDAGGGSDLILVSMALADFSSDSVIACTAFSIPRFRPRGLAPAATLRRPSRTSAWARTVAVVVPSPATSSVFLATSLDQLCADLLVRILQLDLLGDGNTSLVIVGAPLSQHDVAALGAERHLDRVSEGVKALLEAWRASSS